MIHEITRVKVKVSSGNLLAVYKRICFEANILHGKCLLREERDRTYADTIPFNEVSKRGRFLQILFLLFLNLISLTITEMKRVRRASERYKLL